MPEETALFGNNGGTVVTTTVKETVTTKTETTVEVREKEDADGVRLVTGQGPMPVKVTVKNFTAERFPMDKIINELWIPIRKMYRLVHNVDIVMCPIACTIPEKDCAGVLLTDKDGRPIESNGTMFHFLWSKTYNDFGLDTEEEFIYQKLTRRENVKGDIRSFPDDPTKVRMVFVTREIYEKFVKSEKQKEARHRSKTTIVRKMRIPSNSEIMDLMEAAVNEFISAVRDYIDAQVPEDEEKPTVISFKYE